MLTYRKNRYDILLNRPGVLVHEKPVKECYLIYGKRHSGKTTYLLNHARNLPHTDIICFITRVMEVREALRYRTATFFLSPEKKIHLQGQCFDWIYIDDYDSMNVMSYETVTESWALMDRARKGVLASINDPASTKYFNMAEWKLVELGEPHF